MQFVELNEKEYRKFEQEHKYGNLYQEVERVELRRRMGWQANLLGVKEKNKIVAACLIISNKGDSFVPMGPMMDWENEEITAFFIQKITEWAKQQKYHTLEIWPPLHLSYRNYKGDHIEDFDQDQVYKIFEKLKFNYLGRTDEMTAKSNRWVATKDVSNYKNEDELIESYLGKVRYTIRHFSDKVTIEEVTDEAGIEEVSKAISASNDKNKVKSRSNDYYKWIKEIWGDRAHFILAKNKANGETVAGHVTFDTPTEIVSFNAGTVQKYRQLNAMTLINHKMFADTLPLKTNRSNMYGLAGNFDKSNKLLMFKTGFNTQIEEYIGGFRIILSPSRYAMAKTRQKVQGLIRRVKNLAKK